MICLRSFGTHWFRCMRPNCRRTQVRGNACRRTNSTVDKTRLRGSLRRASVPPAGVLVRGATATATATSCSDIERRLQVGSGSDVRLLLIYLCTFAPRIRPAFLVELRLTMEAETRTPKDGIRTQSDRSNGESYLERSYLRDADKHESLCGRDFSFTSNETRCRCVHRCCACRRNADRTIRLQVVALPSWHMLIMQHEGGIL